MSVRSAAPDVVIVGAGAAGLAAARACAQRGLTVDMLEARANVGGRAQSIDVPGVAVPLELGPEFVHGRPDVTLSLLREFGLAEIETSDDAWVRDGNELRRLAPDEGFAAASDLVRRAAAVLGPEDDATVDAALRPFDVGESADAARWARALVAGFDAADVTCAGIRAVAAEWAGDESAAAGESRIVHGYGALFSALACSLDPQLVRLRLRTVVRSIVWRRGEVRVEATGVDGDPLTVRAPRAIVTLPVGVLAAGDVRFEPGLAPSVRDGLARMAAGSVLKVLLVFRSAWWERLDDGRYRDGAFFHRATDAGFATYWSRAPLHVPVLTAWSGGSAAASLLRCDEPQLIAAALDGLRDLFGVDAAAQARDELVVAHAHDWQRDPFARGAYSYALAGAGDARQRLVQPMDGTLVLAGEAASETVQAGTVAGAMQSGIAAVKGLFG